MLPGRRRLRESPTRWALLEPITPRDRICLRTREIGNFCNRSPFARDSGSLADAALGCSAAPRREWLRLPQWERIDATEEPGTRSPCSTPRALLRRDHRPHGAPPPLWPLAAQPLGAQPPAPLSPAPSPPLPSPPTHPTRIAHPCAHDRLHPHSQSDPPTGGGHAYRSSPRHAISPPQQPHRVPRHASRRFSL